MNEDIFNKVAWFEIGSSKAEETKKFFKNVFGWDYKANTNLDGVNYTEIFENSSEKTTGGILGTKKPEEDYAIFYVLVKDANKTIADVKENGGQVVWGPVTDAAGITFVRLLDNQNHQFGVFSVK